MDNIGKFNLIAFSVLHTCFVKFPKATEFDYEENTKVRIMYIMLNCK